MHGARVSERLTLPPAGAELPGTWTDVMIIVMISDDQGTPHDDTSFCSAFFRALSVGRLDIGRICASSMIRLSTIVAIRKFCYPSPAQSAERRSGVKRAKRAVSRTTTAR